MVELVVELVVVEMLVELVMQVVEMVVELVEVEEEEKHVKNNDIVVEVEKVTSAEIDKPVKPVITCW